MLRDREFEHLVGLLTYPSEQPRTAPILQRDIGVRKVVRHKFGNAFEPRGQFGISTRVARCSHCIVKYYFQFMRSTEHHLVLCSEVFNKGLRSRVKVRHLTWRSVIIKQVFCECFKTL